MPLPCPPNARRGHQCLAAAWLLLAGAAATAASDGREPDGAAADPSPPAALPVMLPEAPVEDFSLPHFGPDGERAWLLEGRRGTLIDAATVEVEGMQLAIFDPGDPLQPRLVIASPHARLDLRQQRANGEQFLQVTERDGEFSLTGRRWTWVADDRKITVREDARVSFRQALGPVLTLE